MAEFEKNSVEGKGGEGMESNRELQIESHEASQTTTPLKTE